MLFYNLKLAIHIQNNTRIQKCRLKLLKRTFPTQITPTVFNLPRTLARHFYIYSPSQASEKEAARIFPPTAAQ